VGLPNFSTTYMKKETKILLVRELFVATGFFSCWFVAVLLLSTTARNFSRNFLFDLSFYFILLYMFYLLDRGAIWVIEKYVVKDKDRKRKLFDSVSIIFIIVSMAGYFLILLWYNLVLPTKIT